MDATRVLVTVTLKEYIYPPVIIWMRISKFWQCRCTRNLYLREREGGGRVQIGTAFCHLFSTSLFCLIKYPHDWQSGFHEMDPAAACEPGWWRPREAPTRRKPLRAYSRHRIHPCSSPPRALAGSRAGGYNKSRWKSLVKPAGQPPPARSCSPANDRWSIRGWWTRLWQPIGHDLNAITCTLAACPRACSSAGPFCLLFAWLFVWLLEDSIVWLQSGCWGRREAELQTDVKSVDQRVQGPSGCVQTPHFEERVAFL